MAGFITESAMLYAGKHLLIDAHNCKNNADMMAITTMLISACKNIGATVLFSHAHPFNGGGSSGVIILAESHCTWHQWPEENFVAIDIFVCGGCDPNLAIELIVELFEPTYVNTKLEKRGTKMIEHQQSLYV